MTIIIATDIDKTTTIKLKKHSKINIASRFSKLSPGNRDQRLDIESTYKGIFTFKQSNAFESDDGGTCYFLYSPVCDVIL